MIGLAISRSFCGSENPAHPKGYPVAYQWCLSVNYWLPYRFGRWANWRCQRNFFFGHQHEDTTLPGHWRYVYGMRLWTLRLANPQYQVQMNLRS